MINRLIVLLIRRKYHLKKYQKFRFTNQNSGACYYFDSVTLWKCCYDVIYKSGVSLNWLMDNDCRIKKLK